ncbi:MAG: acyl-CoA thioesterase [Desulfobacterota bacterium]|nr:acyl-CoA thioesterase [Thermodesulfobacteriota bacterium]
MKTFITEYRVIYGDCDPFDVVYYGRYFDLFERGRTEMFRDLGLPYREIADQGIYTPVIEAGCTYIQSARYDDLLLIETRIGQIGRARIRFDYSIYRKNPHTLLAEGFTVHAFVNNQRKILRVPPEVIHVVKGLTE